MTIIIEVLTAERLRQHLDDLVDLLQNAVDGGASIGFYPPPLSADEARAYWEGIIADVARGPRLLIAALVDGRVMGCVQLTPETRRNGLHRAEVQKLMVHTAYRKQGIGQALMQGLEAEARSRRLSLLVLDVMQGAAAERLYQREGYVLAGTIPAYARSADGSLHTTAFYYRILDREGWVIR